MGIPVPLLLHLSPTLTGCSSPSALPRKKSRWFFNFNFLRKLSNVGYHIASEFTAMLERSSLSAAAQGRRACRFPTEARVKGSHPPVSGRFSKRRRSRVTIVVTSKLFVSLVSCVGLIATYSTPLLYLGQSNQIAK